MAAKQTATLLGRFVEHQEHWNPLPTKDAQWVIQNPKDAAALCVTAIKSRANATPKAEDRIYRILHPVPSKPVTSSAFKADDTFFNKKASVKIAYCGNNFTSWFRGKVEGDAPEGEPQAFMLTQAAYDSEIIADLGGEDKAEVLLRDIWQLMERQANDGKGVLITNGYANIFYIRDVNGSLRVVFVYWYGGGWLVDAVGRGGLRWGGGGRVFSRNS